jgi:hypothetical protein
MAKGALKFTPIGELNDPSEMTPVMDRAAVRASLEALRRNGLTQLQFEWLQHQGATLDLLSPEEKVLNAPKTLADANRILSMSAYDDLDYMERKLFVTINKIRSRVGALSLSERYDSLPMWAHYADLAKGFVVVVEDLEKTLKGDETGSLNIPKPVVYADRFLGMTYDPCSQDRLFFSKLSDWSYEREWRVVTALSACRQSADGSLYFRNVFRHHVTAVICGWRVPADDIEALGDELKQVNPDAKLISSTFAAGRIELDAALQ